MSHDLGERARHFKFLVRDRDSKFTAAFDEMLPGTGVRTIKTPTRSRRASPFAERYAERCGASARTTC